MLPSCRPDRLLISALRAHAFHAVKEQGIRDPVRISIWDEMEEIHADVGGVRHIIKPRRHIVPAVLRFGSGKDLSGGQASVAGGENVGVPAFIVAPLAVSVSASVPSVLSAEAVSAAVSVAALSAAAVEVPASTVPAMETVSASEASEAAALPGLSAEPALLEEQAESAREPMSRKTAVADNSLFFLMIFLHFRA